MPRRRAETLGMFLVRRIGFSAGTRVCGLLAAWAWWLATHNDEAPEIKALAGTTGRTRATYYRTLEDFRRAFPGEQTPERIARLIVAESQHRAVAKRESQPVLAAFIMSVPKKAVLGE